MRGRGGYIGFNRVPAAAAAHSAASGVWTLREAEAMRRAGTWPFSSSTVLLLHMEGSGQTFADSSPVTKTVTAGGNATQTTDQSKFGSQSAAFDGSGDSIFATSSEFVFGTQDFTIECWLRPNWASSAAFARVIQAGDFPSNGGWQLVRNSSGTGLIFDITNGESSQARLQGGALTSGQWYHVAVTRSGSALRMFINGAQVHSVTSSPYSLTSDHIRIGGNSTGGDSLSGHIDEVRLSRGEARYTGAFSEPTAAFPDS
jgi:hypothetical protein